MLRRRDGSERLVREMEARFFGIGRELESRVGTLTLNERWGTERTEAERALLHLQWQHAGEVRALVKATGVRVSPAAIRPPKVSNHYLEMMAGIVDAAVTAAISEA